MWVGGCGIGGGVRGCVDLGSVVNVVGDARVVTCVSISIGGIASVICDLCGIGGIMILIGDIVK